MGTMTESNFTSRRLLAVLAHPDDEAFGIGGTLALYAQQGVEVYLICATLGEAGSVSEEFLSNGQTISELRSQELQCSAQALGLKQVILLGYRDSGMAGSPNNQHLQALIAQPMENVVEKIANYMREIKPNIVLTFDPLGGYQHPDHIRIHEATVQAFNLVREDCSSSASDLPARLYFHVMPKGIMRTSIFFLRLSGKNPHKFGKNGDIDLAAIADQDFPIHARINYQEVADKQANAAACHASQGGGRQPRGAQALFSRLFNRPVDRYMQAYPLPSPAQKVRKDLFEGLP